MQPHPHPSAAKPPPNPNPPRRSRACSLKPASPAPSSLGGEAAPQPQPSAAKPRLFPQAGIAGALIPDSPFLMCGRYTTVSTVSVVKQRFRVQVPAERVWEPNANVSAGAAAPVIADEAPGEVQLMQFGFTPRWAKKQFYTLNARSEGDSNPDDDPRYAGAMGILRKPMFRQSIRDRRCLVVVDGFIEGPKDLKLSRPFLVYPRDGRPMALAGIWDEWAHPETGEVVRSFAILTTVANPTLQAIGHHRSPVVLDPDDERAWIDPAAPIAEVTALMRPCPVGRLNAHPIAPAIRDPRAQGSELLRPTGELIHPEHRFIPHEHLELFGMGEGRARNRPRSGGPEQLPLFS